MTSVAALGLAVLVPGCSSNKEERGARACAADLSALSGTPRAGTPAELATVTNRLAAAKRAPGGRSAQQLLRGYSRNLGLGVIDDPKAVQGFYDQLDAKDLRAAGPWRRSREGRALDWFALQPTMFGIAGTRAGPVTAEVQGKRPTLTGRDPAGQVRWRRRLPAGLAPDDQNRIDGTVDLHAAGNRVTAVIVASRHAEQQPYKGDLVVAVVNARTGRVESCQRRTLSSKGVPPDALENTSDLPHVDSALPRGGHLLVAAATPNGTSIEALAVPGLRRRWTRRLDWRVGDLAANDGLVAVSRDPEVVDEDAARTSPNAPQVVALDSATGRVRWTARKLPPSLAADYGPRAPANLIAATPAGKSVVALAATSATTHDNRPVHLVVLDRRSGRITQVGPSLGQGGTFPQLALTNGAALVKLSGPAAGTLVGVDRLTGRPLWKRGQDADLDAPSAAVHGGVLPGGYDQAVIDPRDGRAAPLALRSWFTASSQAVSGKRVFVWDGSLRLLLALRAEALPAP